MAIIPLKNVVQITPYLGYDPDYQEPIYGEPYTERCRISETAKLTRNQHGQEVLSSAQFYFDKLAMITLNDTIEFTNENGITNTFRPISIETKRGLNGKAMLTVVNC